jgi:hypothetical protein
MVLGELLFNLEGRGWGERGSRKGVVVVLVAEGWLELPNTTAEPPGRSTQAFGVTNRTSSIDMRLVEPCRFFDDTMGNAAAI